MNIQFFERKGVTMFTLNGEPMSTAQQEKYRKECELALKKYQRNKKD